MDPYKVFMVLCVVIGLGLLVTDIILRNDILKNLFSDYSLNVDKIMQKALDSIERKTTEDKKVLIDILMCDVVNNPCLNPNEKREIVEKTYSVEYKKLKEAIFKQVKVFEMRDKIPFTLCAKSDLYKGAYSILINSGLEEEYKKWREDN